jgi:hypothetical protein
MADIKIDFGGPTSPTSSTPVVANTASAQAVGKVAATPADKPIPQIKLDSISPANASAPTAPAQTSAPTSATPAGTPPAKQGVDIFSKLSSKTNAPIMVESIIAGKAEAATKIKPILGNPAQVQRALEQEKEYALKKKMRLMQTTATAAFVLLIFIFVYFYSQLSTSFSFFGPNTMAKLTDVNKNLIGLQTKINKYRYLAAQQDLNQFSILADQFLGSAAQMSDPNTSSTVRSQLAATISEAKTEMPIVLQRIQTNLGQDIVIKTLPSESDPQMDDEQLKQQFESELRIALMDDKTNITRTSKGQENLQDIKLIDNAIRIIGNRELINTINGVSLETLKKDMDDFVIVQTEEKRKNLQNLFTNILSTTRSDLATISAIKNARINWSTVIAQLETVTAETDNNFGKGLYDTLGGILYNGYEFDTQANKIVLSGTTKTNDATNFTLMSNFLDDLEGSIYFKNIDMRSFTKSGSADTGYVTSFKIDFNLETDATSSTDSATISLNKNAAYERAKLKKIGIAKAVTAKTAANIAAAKK